MNDIPSWLNQCICAGDAEKQYWEKLVADRERKLNSKTRNKKRGKDKVQPADCN